MSGNQAFEREEFEKASVFYSSALHHARLAVAEAWNGRSGVAQMAAAIMVISTSNAARNALASDRPELIVQEFRAAIEIFLQALESTRAHEALQEACLQHLPKLISNIMTINSEMETSTPELIELAARGQTAAMQHWRSSAR